jgi:hypothetical protein
VVKNLKKGLGKMPRRSYYQKHKAELMKKQRERRARKSNELVVFDEEVREIRKVNRKKDVLDPWSEGFNGANVWKE